MPNQILVDGIEVSPISIKQVDELELYKSIRKWGPLPRWDWFLATQEVLKLIIVNREVADPTKQTVWHFWKRYGQDIPIRSFHEKIGTGFTDISSANRSFFLSEKSALKTFCNEIICSYQLDDFMNGEYGVSTKLTFELVSLTGKTRTVNCISGIAGLNGWENLALGLGLNYRLGLIKPDDEQVQNILILANKSAENQPSSFRPKGNSIGQYVRNLFYLINRDLPQQTT